MVDEVEISNVGGPKGVASEATLAALVSAISKGDTNRDRGLRLEALAMSANTKSIKNNSKEQGIFGKAVSGTASAVTGLGKEFLFGGNRLSDFSRAVFGADSAITSLVKYTDSLIDTYRELSSVGASFNNSLFDFIKTSAMTGMSLGDFSDLVSQNSTRLRMLGGTVTEGTKRFGQISKTLRQDFGVGLSRVGFTMSAMNDVLLEYTDFSIRRQGREIRSDKEVAASAAQFAMELDQYSRLTGISRKQLAESVAQQTQDQRIRSAMAAMTDEQAENFGQALAVAGQYSDGFKEAILGMVNGVPTNDFAKGLFQSSDAFKSYAASVKDMDPDELMNFAKTVANESAEYYEEFGGLYGVISNDIFRAGGDVSAALGSIRNLTDEEIKKAKEEQAAYDRLTAVLVAFENALNNVKTFLMDELFGENAPFGRSLKAFSESITKLVNSLFGESGTGGTAGGLTSGFQGIIDSLFGEEGYLTRFVNYMTGLVNTITASDDPWNAFTNKVGELGTNIKNWFMDMLLGTKTESRDRQETSRSGGLLESISDGVSGLFNDPSIQTVITNFFTDMKDMFSRLIEEIILSVNQSTGGVLFGDQSAAILESRINDPNAAPLTSAQRATLAEERYEAKTSELDEAANYLIESTGSLIDLAANSVYGALGVDDYLQSDLGGMYNRFTRYDPTLEKRSIGTLGTTGFKFEPKDTVAQLHRGERVLSPEETAKYNSTGNQTMSNEKLDQLNNTMMRVAGLLDSALGVQTRTMKNVKSLGFDYYRGSPA